MVLQRRRAPKFAFAALVLGGGFTSGAPAWAQERSAPAAAPAPSSSPTNPTQGAPGTTAAPAPAPTSAAPAPAPPATAAPAPSSNGPVVEQVQVSDQAPPPPPAESDAEPPPPPQQPDEPPVPPPPAPLPRQENASFSFGIGFQNALTSIRHAFPWGFDVGLQGSLHAVGPLHATLGLQLSSLQLRNAGTTGYYVCDYGCAQETESGVLVTVPLGVALHAPLGEHRLIFGAGGLYSWYSANTYQHTGLRKGPGGYGRVTFSFHGWRSVYYDLFVDTSFIRSSGERFQGRLSNSASTDLWLNFGFAVRFGL